MTAFHHRTGDQPIVVIGAGVAGLTAALHLAERGLPVLVLEAEPTTLGGRLRDMPAVTFEHQGRMWSFPQEHGVHGIWQGYYNLKQLLQRHTIMPELHPSPDESWIHGIGRQVKHCAIGRAIHTSPIPAPFHYLHLFTRLRFVNMLSPRDLIALPQVIGTLLVALAIDPIAEQEPMAGHTLASFTEGWPPILRGFFASLARNALAARPEEIPLAGFIAFLRFYTIARRDAWAFGVLPGTGGGCVIEPLVERLKYYGGNVEQGTTVHQLEQHASSWLVHYNSSYGEQRQPASHVVLAVDAHAAQKILAGSPASMAYAQQMHVPIGIPTVIMRLWFAKQPRRLAPSGIFSGDFTVDNFFWLDQLQPAYTEWSQATGGSAIEMHIYGPANVVEQPDAALLAQAISDVSRAFPEVANQVLEIHIQRNPASHTLFSVGTAATHLGVRTPWPNLVACGDWVAHPAPALYLERAATTGIAAANEVLRLHGLPEWPLLEHPAPEASARVLGGWLTGFRRWWRARRSQAG